MPEIYRANLNPTRAYQAYAQTYVERDVRQLIQVKEQLVLRDLSSSLQAGSVNC